MHLGTSSHLTTQRIYGLAERSPSRFISAAVHSRQPSNLNPHYIPSRNGYKELQTRVHVLTTIPPPTMAAEPTLGSVEHKLSVDVEGVGRADRVQLAQWLRAAVLGATDGLVSTTSLMLGVGAVKEDRWSMTLSGLAGAVAGAFSMAVGEFVSVSTQRDIEKTGRKIKDTTIAASPARSPFMRAMASAERKDNNTPGGREEEEVLPNPVKAAAASGVAYLSGALVPLLASAFVAEYTVRVVALVVATSVALVGCGAIGARLGGSPVVMSSARVLIGGWIAMGVTYLLLKPLDRENDRDGDD